MFRNKLSDQHIKKHNKKKNLPEGDRFKPPKSRLRTEKRPAGKGAAAATTVDTNRIKDSRWAQKVAAFIRGADVQGRIKSFPAWGEVRRRRRAGEKRVEKSVERAALSAVLIPPQRLG